MIKSSFSRLFLLMLFVSGCASQKEWMAVGGSRSDGTVKLAFEYGMFEKPIIDQAQGYNLALRKCQVWGYSGTEPFGSSFSQCIATNQYGCVRWRVFTEYQCTSGSAPSAVNNIEPIGQGLTEDTPLPVKKESNSPSGVKIPSWLQEDLKSLPQQ